MNISSMYKLGFLGLIIVFLGGLSGCVQQAVVSTHHRVAVVEPILITSNLAYYEKYGYPAGYHKPYYAKPVRPYYSAPAPRPIVVKKVKVIHSKPVYVKSHRPAPIKQIKKHSPKHNVKKEYRPNHKSHNKQPVKNHSKPSSQPHKATPKSKQGGLIDAVNQAKHSR
ncbi:hypothetical protein JCM30760_25280 [Thiomicrorhabdus hydrogeniphila]